MVPCFFWSPANMDPQEVSSSMYSSTSIICHCSSVTKISLARFLARSKYPLHSNILLSQWNCSNFRYGWWEITATLSENSHSNFGNFEPSYMVSHFTHILFDILVIAILVVDKKRLDNNSVLKDGCLTILLENMPFNPFQVQFHQKENLIHHLAFRFNEVTSSSPK